METLSLMRQAHPCVPGTLAVCAGVSLYTAVKGITLTFAALSTAHVAASLVGLYLCFGTILTTIAALGAIKRDLKALNTTTDTKGQAVTKQNIGLVNSKTTGEKASVALTVYVIFKLTLCLPIQSVTKTAKVNGKGNA